MREKKRKVLAIGASFLITLSFICVGTALSYTFMHFIYIGTKSPMVITSVWQFLYCIVALILLKMKKRKLKEVIGIRMVAPLNIVIPFVAGLTISGFSNMIQVLFPQLQTGNVSQKVMANSNMATIFIAAFLVAPFVEEFVFRGLIIDVLSKEYSEVVIVLMSAFLFGAIHYISGGVYLMLHAMIGGVVMALARVKTKSIFSAIVTHIAGNFGAIVTTLAVSLSKNEKVILTVVCLVISMFSCFCMSEMNRNK